MNTNLIFNTKKTGYKKLMNILKKLPTKKLISKQQLKEIQNVIKNKIIFDF